MAYIKSYPNQNYLIPPNLSDLFSEGHVCYLIEQIANEMDYSKFDQKYEGAGHPAYHPRILVKLIAMAQVDSIRSSRKIAKASQGNVVYIYLAEKTQPDFRTINEFRKNNRKLVKSCLREVRRFAREKGLLDLSHLSVDGTIIEANSNDQKVIRKDQLKKIDKWVDKYLDEADRIDEEEDKIYGDRGMHELPPDLLDPKKRQPIVRKIVDRIKESMEKDDKEDLKEVKKELHEVKHVMEKQGVDKFSFTDKDARFMRNKKMKIELSYNAQITVDKNGLIIANDVVQDSDDRNQLIPEINQVEKNFGQLPEGTKITADPGYEKGEALAELEERGFDLFVPGKGMTSQPKKFAKANFSYDEEKDVYICPENKILKKSGNYVHSQKQVPTIRYSAEFNDCQACPHRQACCKKQKKRFIDTLPEDKLFHRIKKKLKTEEGKAIYGLRKQTVETAFGDIKENKKFRGFLLRGLEKVKIEFDWVCLARNLVMINNMLNRRKGLSC